MNPMQEALMKLRGLQPSPPSYEDQNQQAIAPQLTQTPQLPGQAVSRDNFGPRPPAADPSVAMSALSGLRVPGNMMPLQDMIKGRLTQEDELTSLKRNMYRQQQNDLDPNPSAYHHTVYGVTPPDIEKAQSDLDASPNFGRVAEANVADTQAQQQKATMQGFGSPQEAGAFGRMLAQKSIDAPIQGRQEEERIKGAAGLAQEKERGNWQQAVAGTKEKGYEGRSMAQALKAQLDSITRLGVANIAGSDRIKAAAVSRVISDASQALAGNELGRIPDDALLTHLQKVRAIADSYNPSNSGGGVGEINSPDAHAQALMQKFPGQSLQRYKEIATDPNNHELGLDDLSQLPLLDAALRKAGAK